MNTETERVAKEQLRSLPIGRTTAPLPPPLRHRIGLIEHQANLVGVSRWRNQSNFGCNGTTAQRGGSGCIAIRRHFVENSQSHRAQGRHTPGNHRRRMIL